MKIKVMSRNPDAFLRETKKDICKMPRHSDATLQPLQLSRECVSALNSVKLERAFVKPFLGSLDGHRDGISCILKHPQKVSVMLSGSCDGEVRIWNLPRRKCIHSIAAHDGFVRGLCCHPSASHFYSCGDDMSIKQWRCINDDDDDFSDEMLQNSILGKTVFRDIDHHWSSDTFVTCGQQVDIWDDERAEPVHSFRWGVEGISHVRFNPVEKNIIGATGCDRNVLLYDSRGSVPLHKVTLKQCSNALAWNPMEAFDFTVANEDYNLYTFDLRNLSRAKCVHMDHVLSVLDVDYSPTGQEFVSGSYDKTVRIFPVNGGHSREVYHTKRMQRVVAVKWSLDSKFILSGSEEMNLRLWKAQSSMKLGVLRPREKEAFNYASRLKEKYRWQPEVRRIAHHRHVPKSVHVAQKELRTIRTSQKRKEANIRAHSALKSVPCPSERSKHIISEVD